MENKVTLNLNMLKLEPYYDLENENFIIQNSNNTNIIEIVDTVSLLDFTDYICSLDIQYNESISHEIIAEKNDVQQDTVEFKIPANAIPYSSSNYTAIFRLVHADTMEVYSSTGIHFRVVQGTSSNSLVRGTLSNFTLTELREIIKNFINTLDADSLTGYQRKVVDTLLDEDGNLISGGAIEQAIIDVVNNLKNTQLSVNDNLVLIQELQDELGFTGGDLESKIDKKISDVKGIITGETDAKVTNLDNKINTEIADRIAGDTNVLNTNAENITHFQKAFEDELNELRLNIAQFYQLQEDPVNLPYVQDGNLVKAILKNKLDIDSTRTELETLTTKYFDNKTLTDAAIEAIRTKFGEYTNTADLTILLQDINAEISAANAKILNLQTEVGEKVNTADYDANNVVINQKTDNLQSQIDDEITDRAAADTLALNKINTNTNQISANTTAIATNKNLQDIVNNQVLHDITALQNRTGKIIVTKLQGETDEAALKRVITAPYDTLQAFVYDPFTHGNSNNLVEYIYIQATTTWLQQGTHTATVDLTSYYTKKESDTKFVSNTDLQITFNNYFEWLGATTFTVGARLPDATTEPTTGVAADVNKVVYYENQDWLLFRINQAGVITYIWQPAAEGHTLTTGQVLTRDSFIEFFTSPDGLKNIKILTGAKDTNDYTFLEGVKNTLTIAPNARTIKLGNFVLNDLDSAIKANASAIEGLKNSKQDHNVPTLTTTSKTVDGSINEINGKVDRKIENPIGNFTKDFVETKITSNDYSIIAYPDISDKSKYIAMIWDKLYKEFRIENYTTADGVITTIAGDAYSIRNRTNQLLRIYNDGKHNTSATHTLIQLLDYVESTFGNIGDIATLKTSIKTNLVSAINELVDNKQDKTDNALNTVSKNMTQAINEILALTAERKIKHVLKPYFDNYTPSDTDLNFVYAAGDTIDKATYHRIYYKVNLAAGYEYVEIPANIFEIISNLQTSIDAKQPKLLHVVESATDVSGQNTLNIGENLVGVLRIGNTANDYIYIGSHTNGSISIGQSGKGILYLGYSAEGDINVGQNGTGNQKYAEVNWPNLPAGKTVEFNFGQALKTIGTNTNVKFATRVGAGNWTPTTHTADAMIKVIDSNFDIISVASKVFNSTGDKYIINSSGGTSTNTIQRLNGLLDTLPNLFYKQNDKLGILGAVKLQINEHGHVFENDVDTGKDLIGYIVGKSIAALPPSLPTWTSTSLESNGFVNWDKPFALLVGKTYLFIATINDKEYSMNLKISDTNFYSQSQTYTFIYNFTASPLQNPEFLNFTFVFGATGGINRFTQQTNIPTKIKIIQLD